MPDFPRVYGQTTHDIISFDAIGLAPSAHNIRVIEGKDRNYIDAFRFDLPQILDVAW